MKHIILSFSFCLLAFATYAQNEYAGQKFGEAIEPSELVTAKNIAETMGSVDSLPMKLTGKVIEVCAKKGCWMTLQMPNGDPMRVTFKDYAFFMPKDIAGKTVVLQGFAKKTTTSVATLRHYAEDAKKTSEEISKITQPKDELAFEANGVVILDK